MKRGDSHRLLRPHASPAGTGRSAFVARRGIALVPVIVALTIFTALCFSLTSIAIQREWRLQRDAAAAQRERLVDAALLRARERLRRDPEWTGETWRAELPGQGVASSALVVTTTRAPGGRELKIVVATLDGAPVRFRMEHSVTLPDAPAASQSEALP
ncbi:MAG: hypothetical protein KF774_08615 [Planctomyces sp.]|nr:hypothetical protein [Planctomyces sp.]